MRIAIRQIGAGTVLLFGLVAATNAAPSGPNKARMDAAFYLVPHTSPGESLSFITYRVISLYGPGIEGGVVSLPATGTYTFKASKSADAIGWNADVRMDGKRFLKGIEGEYRDGGTTICYSENAASIRTQVGHSTTRRFGAALKVNWHLDERGL